MGREHGSSRPHAVHVAPPQPPWPDIDGIEAAAHVDVAAPWIDLDGIDAAVHGRQPHKLRGSLAAFDRCSKIRYSKLKSLKKRLPQHVRAIIRLINLLGDLCRLQVLGAFRHIGCSPSTAQAGLVFCSGGVDGLRPAIQVDWPLGY